MRISRFQKKIPTPKASIPKMSSLRPIMGLVDPRYSPTGNQEKDEKYPDPIGAKTVGPTLLPWIAAHFDATPLGKCPNRHGLRFE
jgi:hypothetical protein